MYHCDDFEQLRSHAVDDAVRRLDHLTEGALPNFRYDAAGERMTVETFYRGDEPFGKDPGLPR